MTIPTLPSAPLVTDIPADFNTKAFNWVAALDNWTTEANATGVAADADAATATSAAGTATTQAGTATTQAGIATSAASTATTQAGIATTKAGEANASAVAAAASAASINLNSIDINGGTIDGTVIGGAVPAAGSFTSLSASGSVSMTATNPGLLFTSSNFQVYKLSNDIRVYTEGVDRAIFNSTGLAVTGALSATGVGSVGGAAAALNAFTINQASTYAETITNGSQAYAWRLHGTSLKLSDRTAFTEKLEVSSTGLAVTGALSASDSIRGGSGATYKFALDYSVSGDVAGELANSHASGYGYRIKGGTTSNYALLVQSQDSTNILEAKKGSVAVTGALSAGNGTITGIISYSSRVEMGASSNHSLGLITNNTTQAILDTSGNLGLGVTPSAWSTYKAIQVGYSGAVFSNPSANEVYLSSNYYFGSAADRYIQNGLASAYKQLNGTHSWYTAPSGTAGNAITFTQAMTLDASGNLLMGATSLVGTERLSISAGANTGAFIKVTADANVPLALWNSATSGDNLLTGFYTEASPTSRGSIDYNRAGGLVRYNTTSDYRAKDVYGPVLDSGSQVDALKVYRGKMKGATMERPMLIAHEAQEVAPYAVSGVKDAINEDGTPLFQQVDTSSLVPLLIAELQSLRARVAQLEGI